MADRRPIAEEVQQLVRKRAKYLCEYCHGSEKWQYVPFTRAKALTTNRNT